MTEHRNSFRLLRKPKYLTHIIIVWSIIFFSALFLAFSAAFGNSFEPNHISESGGVLFLNNDWEYIDLDGVRQSASLPLSIEWETDAPLTINRTLPASRSIGTTLCFRTHYQSVKVALDGKTIYEYNTDADRLFGKVTPGGLNFIPLDIYTAGSTISLTFVSSLGRFSGEVGEVMFGSYGQLLMYQIGGNLPEFIASVIVLTMGVFTSICTLLLSRKRRDYRALFYLSVFISLIGIWLCCEAPFPHIYRMTDFIETLMTHLSLMICPLPFVLFLKYRFDRRFHRLLNILFIIFFCNFIMCCSLQLFNVLDFVEIVHCTQFLMIIGLIVTVMLYLIYYTENRILHPRLELLGLAALVITGVAENITFFLTKYNSTGSVFAIGLIVYFVCLVASSLLDVFERASREAVLSKELQESRIRLMISQIRPHFVYNTLGAIRTMIKVSPDTAYDMIYDFSKYLRANIGSLDSNERITFDAEVEHIKTYLKIESARFGDRLSVKYEINSEDFRLPPLSIQPIVENAVKHGVCKKVEGGTVTLRSYKNSDGSFTVEVEDDGVGFNVEETLAENSKSIGIKNITYRLENTAKATVKIESTVGKGTKVSVLLPESAGI